MRVWSTRETITSIAVATLALLFTTIVHGQDRTESQTQKTRIEAFEAQAGTVVVRGFSKVGELRGVYGGVLTVQSMEFRDATTGKKEYGISIDVKETGRLERSNRLFIDYEEIESLLKGIDYVATLDKSSTKLDNFQADYRTKGDLRISTFSSGNDIMTSVASGSIGATSLFLRIADLGKLRDLVLTAKSKLDSMCANKL